MKRWLNLLCACCLLLAGMAGADTQPLVLGVYDHLPPDVLKQRMAPLMQRLSRELGGPLELRVLGRAALDQAMTRNELDLVLTNPSHYLELRSRSALTGALATIIRGIGPHSTSSLGGVIIVRAGSPVERLEQVRGVPWPCLASWASAPTRRKPWSFATRA
ncbi:MAG: hypothetical protein RJA10_2524 [Pseudomonadota bacterium]